MRQLPEPFANAWILTGPTSAGKTELGLALAERLGAEIVSMDSMALYRLMDIGTAKPSADERRRIPHHLVDVLDPWESANVAWWRERAAACCREIESRGRAVLFVGGTPLYLKALLYGLFDGPPSDRTLRQRLLAEAEHSGEQALHARLQQVDPATAARLHPHDVRRVIRALEVWELTGKPMSAWQQEWPNPPATDDDYREIRKRCFCLQLPRAELYARIDERVRRMFAAGLVEEVAGLRKLPRPLSREASQALGYKEVFHYLDGIASLDETIARVQTRSRQFAKRQLTWFRRLPECQPITRELTFLPGELTMRD